MPPPSWGARLPPRTTRPRRRSARRAWRRAPPTRVLCSGCTSEGPTRFGTSAVGSSSRRSTLWPSSPLCPSQRPRVSRRLSSDTPLLRLLRYAPIIAEWRALHPAGLIYVATDSPSFAAELTATLGSEAVVMYDAIRSERNAFADSSLTDNYKKGEDALVEALILSCANFLVKPVRIGTRLGRPTPPPPHYPAPPPTTIRRRPCPSLRSISARASTRTPSSCSTSSGGHIPMPRSAPASAAPATPPAAPSAARRFCGPTCERRRTRPACRSRRWCERVRAY